MVNTNIKTIRGAKLSENEVESPDFVLEARGLVKEFKGFIAVDKVDLCVKRGHIHALIGPNGAGKSTCFNLLTKFHTPTRGHIQFEGSDITHESPVQIARRGIVRSFQISSVFPSMTAVDNVIVALQRKLGMYFQFWRSARPLRQLREEARELLDSVGLGDAADVVASELPYGRKRALELATTLALNPKFLLLDEPTQGMAHDDVDRVMSLISKVAASRTVLMVEHNMKVVSSISDRITVLAQGAVLAEGSYEQVSRDTRVIEAYMGTVTPGAEQEVENG